MRGCFDMCAWLDFIKMSRPHCYFCAPLSADTWVSLYPKQAQPLWSWTCGRHNISTVATSTSWPRSWPTLANRKPWYSWSLMASANLEKRKRLVQRKSTEHTNTNNKKNNNSNCSWNWRAELSQCPSSSLQMIVKSLCWSESLVPTEQSTNL